MKSALAIANLFLLLINIALFCLWFSMIKKDAAITSGEQATYILNQVSVQVTILGTMVAFGALFLAGLGVFGFQAVLERAASQAEISARKLTSQRLDDFLKSGNVVVMGQRNGPLPKVDDATEVSDR